MAGEERKESHRLDSSRRFIVKICWIGSDHRCCTGSPHFLAVHFAEPKRRRSREGRRLHQTLAGDDDAAAASDGETVRRLRVPQRLLKIVRRR